MASKKILAQLELQEVSSLTSPASGFVGFSAKADGLYQKIGTEPELRLLTSADVQNAILADGSITGAVSQAQIFTMGVKLSNLTQGYIPYASGSTKLLSNSPIYTDGTNVGIGTTNLGSRLQAAGIISAPSLTDFRGYDSLVNKVISPDISQVAQSPVSGFLWHDILAFNSTALFETSSNGSIWTAGTLDKRLFSQKEAQSVQVLDASTTKAVRWTWSNYETTWSFVQWMLMAFTYTNPGVGQLTVTVSVSYDDVTWTDVHTSTSGYWTSPYWFNINGAGTDERYFRIKISTDSTSGIIALSSIKLLTTRWGDQGGGSELKYPYSWDENRNIFLNGRLYFGNKLAVDGADTWLRLNNENNFSEGIYTGTGILRTDGNFQVGLNGDRFTVLPSGLVGIGNTSPQGKLDVTHSSTINNENDGGIVVHSGTGAKLIIGSVGSSYNYLQSMEEAVSWLSKPLLIQPNGGKVGIGTTEPTASLHIKAGSEAANTAPIKLTSGVNLTTPESGAIEFSSSRLYFTPSTTRETIAFMSDITSASHAPVTIGAIGTSPNANGMSISGQELSLQPASALYGGILTNGNQTIAGTKTFNGDIIFNNNLSSQGNYLSINFGSGDSYNPAIRMYNSSSEVTPGGSFFTMGENAGAFMAFGREGDGPSFDEKVRITSNGYVGIGVTDPGAKMEIFNSYNTTTPSFMLRERDSADYALAISPYVVGGGNVGYKFSTQNAGGAFIDAMTITGAGNVGIGTTDPTNKLRVSGGNMGLDNNQWFTFRNPENTNDDGVMSYDSSSTLRLNYGSGGLVIQNSGNPQMVINNSNVGIGTTAPNQQLEITKNFRLPSTIGTTPYGIIYKDGNRFIHDFNYGNNGTVTTDGGNTFIGIGAGNLTMGSTATQSYHSSYNTGIGYQSLISNTTGCQNTANGYASFYFNTTGNNNTANGYASLYSNTIGSNNTALGYNSGRYIANGTTGRSTGDNSLYLGCSSKASADGTDNEIVIGYDAIGVGSNKTVIGNSSITDTYFGSSTGASKLWASALNLSSLTASKVVFTDGSKNLTSTGIGTSSQFIKGDGSLDSNTYITSGSVSGFVPYVGATTNVDLGTRSITSTGGFIGNASTATKLQTARNITVGYKTLSFDGTSDISFPINEIGFTQTRLGSNGYPYLSGDIIIQGSGKIYVNQTGQYITVNSYDYSKWDVGLGNVTNDAQWHNGNHPTTIAGYGITDAFTVSGLTANYIPKWNGTTFVDSPLITNSTNSYVFTNVSFVSSVALAAPNISLADNSSNAGQSYIGFDRFSENYTTLIGAGYDQGYISILPENEDGLNVMVGSMSGARDLYVTGGTSTSSIALRSGAVTGYYLKCVNTNGAAEWAPVTASQVYKGTWNASTNTPSLSNGSGVAGWYYRVTTAGTFNSVAYSVGDDIIYNGSIWERIPGAGYSLQTATTTVLGGVKIDGTSVKLNASNQLYVSTNYEAPLTFTGGLSRTGNTVSFTGNISGFVPYEGATMNVNLGSKRLTLDNIHVTANPGQGKVLMDVTGQGHAAWMTPTPYNLPIASSTVLGGIKVGYGLYINPETGLLSVDNDVFVPYQGATWDVNLGSRSIYAYDFVLYSDINLKCNIKSISKHRIDIDYKQFEYKTNEGEKRYGVIAQELLSTAPEFVVKNGDYYAVKYTDLLVYEIVQLKEEIKELKSMLCR